MCIRLSFLPFFPFFPPSCLPTSSSSSAPPSQPPIILSPTQCSGSKHKYARATTATATTTKRCSRRYIGFSGVG
ncbi:hypothetical protein F4775DRAFT_536892 [Biscogniauxia sp. FL1348]|nr:hypothetical protein F4775DRAFT_536892 [Biscogniauxia sp. FL1348]